MLEQARVFENNIFHFFSGRKDTWNMSCSIKPDATVTAKKFSDQKLLSSRRKKIKKFWKIWTLLYLKSWKSDKIADMISRISLKILTESENSLWKWFRCDALTQEA